MARLGRTLSPASSCLQRPVPAAKSDVLPYRYTLPYPFRHTYPSSDIDL